MGLFSFLNKNKQETTAEDSGYYSSADDAAVTARARSKRASSAGEPASRRTKDSHGAADPVLPEKKRARRRLVGAIALALAVAVGLPMVLDSEPKPLAGDIAIRIPAKDKVAPQPVASARPSAVAPAAALDSREEIVAAPKKPAEAAPAVTAAPALAQVDTAALRPEAKSVAKAEPKPAEPKLAAKSVDKPAPKTPPKAEEKAGVAPKQAGPAAETARALAILEGKPGAGPAEPAAHAYVVQVAALASQDKVNELQGKLKEAGIKSFTQKVPTKSGERIRVRVGPFSKDEAEKMRARLARLGFSGSMVPT